VAKSNTSDQNIESNIVANGVKIKDYQEIETTKQSVFQNTERSKIDLTNVVSKALVDQDVGIKIIEKGKTAKGTGLASAHAPGPSSLRELFASEKHSAQL
jgi:hypothetical protein